MLLGRLCTICGTCQQKSTGYSPYEIVFGRKVFLARKHDINLQSGSFQVREYIRDLHNSVQKIHEIVNDNIQKSGKKIKDYHDKNIHQERLNIGDKVLIKSHNHHYPDQKYVGPFQITRMLNNWTYELQRGERVIRRHYDQIKKFHTASEQKPKNTNISKPTTVETASTEINDQPRRYPSRPRRPPVRFGFHEGGECRR